MNIKDWNRNKLFYAAVIFHRFEYIQMYYSELSEYINSQLISINGIIDQLNQGDEGIKERYIDEYADDYYRIKKVLEDNFNKSILMSLYSLIENSLIFICEKVDTELNINKFEKPKSAIVKNSQIFLEKYLDIKLSKDSKQFIYGINIVRNIYVHNNGHLNNIENEKIIDIDNFSKYNGVSGLSIDNKEIIITLEFIDYCIKKSKEYFREILI